MAIHSEASGEWIFRDSHGPTDGSHYCKAVPCWLHQLFTAKKMNRSELIETLVSKTDISKALAGSVLDTLIETIQLAVKKGDSVTLVGFGTFKSVKRAARVGKNPSTGAALKIPAGTVPKFTAGSKFKAAVDPKAAARKKAKAAAK